LVTHLKSHTQRIRTITRTFRLDEKISKMLEEEASKEKITVNSLVSRVLWNYQKRCQYCLHYNLILLEPTIFKAMLDNMPEETIGRFGSSLGPTVVKENLARFGMGIDKESVEFVLMEALGQWTKWYDADMNETNQGRIYYLHHTLGKKWSVFLKKFFERALAELLNYNVPIDITENSVIFTMPTTTKPFKQ
jgi:hypothetical protein